MSHAPSGPRRAELGSKVLVIALVGIFLFGMLGFALAVIDAQGEEPTEPPPPSLPAIPTARPSDVASEAGSGAPARGPILLALAESDATTTAPAVTRAPIVAPTHAPGVAPSPSLAPVAAEPVESVMPIVPVARFWSSRQGLTSPDVRRALQTGASRGFKRVIVTDAVADALATSLDVELHADVRRGDLASVAAAIRRGALGLLPAAQATPAMRLLQIDGLSLVGNDRIRDVADWPLSLRLSGPADERWDQSRTWVLVAGGDSFTDRGVYQKVVQQG